MARVAGPLLVIPHSPTASTTTTPAHSTPDSRRGGEEEKREVRARTPPPHPPFVRVTLRIRGVIGRGAGAGRGRQSQTRGEFVPARSVTPRRPVRPHDLGGSR